MTATGMAKTTVRHRQGRFMAEGVDGLLRDGIRPPGRAPIPDGHAAKAEMTLKSPSHEATHETAPAMAEIEELAVSTVRRIWKAHGLAPHRPRRFQRSDDPAFAEKRHAVARPCVAPPRPRRGAQAFGSIH
ncbi:MAG: hypothetical protein R6V44_12830 [Paracoccaceae bacterium]